MSQPHIQSLVVLGFGKMSAALVVGYLRQSSIDSVTLLNRNGAPKLDALLAAHQDLVCQAPTEPIASGRFPANGQSVILFGIKPQDLAEATPVLRALYQQSPGSVIISVLAGVTVAQLERAVGDSTAPIVRSIPNLPTRVSKGATVSVANAQVTEGQSAQVAHFFQASGLHQWITNETHLDVVTALSGSAPAYYFALTEAISEAGQGYGLSPSLCATLAAQALIGAGALLELQPDPTFWRQAISSPGGTTEAALRQLEADDFRTTIAHAIASATQQGKILSARATRATHI